MVIPLEPFKISFKILMIKLTNLKFIGNPLLISFDKNIKIENINYLDKTRQKNIY